MFSNLPLYSAFSIKASPQFGLAVSIPWGQKISSILGREFILFSKKITETTTILNRTLIKNGRMSKQGKIVSPEQIQEEWQEIQAAQKDPALFRPLYNRYFEPIFRFVYRRTSNEELTADICSQIFLQALQNLKGYQFKGVPFSAWLYRIASNEISLHYRKHQKSRVISLEDTDISDVIEEINEQNDEEHRQLLIQMLDLLKEPDLQLIEMRFFEKRPFKEIAELLDITESNAKVKTYRILERLKKNMKQRIDQSA